MYFLQASQFMVQLMVQKSPENSGRWVVFLALLDKHLQILYTLKGDLVLAGLPFTTNSRNGDPVDLRILRHPAVVL